MEVHVNGESQWRQLGGTMVGQDKHGGTQSWGRVQIPLTRAPAPPGLLRNVWGQGASGRMGRGTYHIQGLPMGVGEGCQRRKENMI